MEAMCKANIIKLEEPVYGNWYDVQIVTSIDGGKTYWYCGGGRFCETLEDAEQYVAEQYVKDHMKNAEK